MRTTLGESNYYFENIHGPDLFLLFSDTYIRAHERQSSKYPSVTEKPEAISWTQSVYIY